MWTLLPIAVSLRGDGRYSLDARLGLPVCMSFHNLRRFRFDNAGLDPDSVRFDAWLAEAVSQPAGERERRLIDWAQAPGGRASHPREEHLLPLHLVAGAAGDDPGRRVFRDQVLGSAQSAYLFGAGG